MNELEKLQYDIARFQLPLVSCNKGLIEFDLSYFKEQVEELEKLVKHQTLDINNVDEFAKLRAKLNNFAKIIDDEKKKVKNEYLQPYTDFENQVKECIKLIKGASVYIDDQLKEYEKQQIQLLKEEFIEMWKAFNKDNFVPFERIEKDYWYLKKTSKKKVLIEMQQISEKIDADIEILKKSINNVDELTEVISNYYITLDIGQTLGEYTKWKNIVKNEKIVVKQVEEETLKTTQEENKNAVKTKFEALNQEIKTNDKIKQVQVIINFTADEDFADYVLNWLHQNNIKFNFRKNNL